ncbi:MAG: hypothetical protein KBC84_08080, partial [Proteobacteria bacterium]|nr:hypothetical protein [Pseudomonadota bacterium]
HYYGTVVTLFSGFVWSVYAVMAKLDKQNSSDSAFNLWVFLFGAIVFYFKTSNVDFLSYEKEDLGLLFALGLVTLLSYSALVVALKHIDTTLVSVIIASEIVILLVILQLMEYLNINIIPIEPISMLANLGALIAVSGIILTIIKNKKEEVEVVESIL